MQDVITNSMLRDIFVANPHSAKSTEMIDQLDTRFDPMPQYMKDEILEGQLIQSVREEKEANRNLSKRAYDYGVNRQLSQLLTDSLRTDNDSIIFLLESEGSLNSRLKLAWLSFEVSSAAIGILLANDIPIYNEPYSVIDMSKNSDPIKEKEEQKLSGEYVFVTPNPAKEFITVKYASVSKTSTINIFNEEGKLVLTKGLQKQIDEITLNTHGYKPGVYIIMLLSEKGKACSSKFIITK